MAGLPCWPPLCAKDQPRQSGATAKNTGALAAQLRHLILRPANTIALNAQVPYPQLIIGSGRPSPARTAANRSPPTCSAASAMSIFFISTTYARAHLALAFADAAPGHALVTRPNNCVRRPPVSSHIEEHSFRQPVGRYPAPAAHHGNLTALTVNAVQCANGTMRLSWSGFGHEVQTDDDRNALPFEWRDDPPSLAGRGILVPSACPAKSIAEPAGCRRRIRTEVEDLRRERMRDCHDGGFPGCSLRLRRSPKVRCAVRSPTRTSR